MLTRIAETNQKKKQQPRTDGLKQSVLTFSGQVTSSHCVNYVVRQHRQTQFDIFIVHKEYKVSDCGVGVPSATTVNIPFFKL